MIMLTLNALFAMGAFAIAMQSFRKGLPFVRDGWNTIQVQTSHADFRYNIERRRAISDGGRFLVGGLFWLLIAALAFVGALYFGFQAFTLLGFT